MEFGIIISAYRQTRSIFENNALHKALLDNLARLRFAPVTAKGVENGEEEPVAVCSCGGPIYNDVAVNLLALAQFLEQDYLIIINFGKAYMLFTNGHMVMVGDVFEINDPYAENDFDSYTEMPDGTVLTIVSREED